VFTLAVTLLTAVILGSVVRPGRSRISWLGFGVFGWTYVLTTFWLWPAPNGVTAPPFLPKALLDYFQPSSNTAAVMWIDTAPPGEMSTEPPSFAGRVRVANRLHFRRIGHTLAALVLSLLGALLGTVFSARSEMAEGQRPLRGQAAEP
jgi:hypothetical protein